MHVSLKALVFCPAVGAKLVGRVNKVGVDFIGLLAGPYTRPPFSST